MGVDVGTREPEGLGAVTALVKGLVRDQVTAANALGFPAAHTPRVERPLRYPAGGELFSFPPPSGRSRLPAGRGLPLVTRVPPVALRCGSCPRPYVHIHMHASRRQ